MPFDRDPVENRSLPGFAPRRWVFPIAVFVVLSPFACALVLGSYLAASAASPAEALRVFLPAVATFVIGVIWIYFSSYGFWLIPAILAGALHHLFTRLLVSCSGRLHATYPSATLLGATTGFIAAAAGWWAFGLLLGIPIDVRFKLIELKAQPGALLVLYAAQAGVLPGAAAEALRLLWSRLPDSSSSQMESVK